MFFTANYCTCIIIQLQWIHSIMLTLTLTRSHCLVWVFSLPACLIMTKFDRVRETSSVYNYQSWERNQGLVNFTLPFRFKMFNLRSDLFSISQSRGNGNQPLSTFFHAYHSLLPSLKKFKMFHHSSKQCLYHDREYEHWKPVQ